MVAWYTLWPHIIIVYDTIIGMYRFDFRAEYTEAVESATLVQCLQTHNILITYNLHEYDIRSSNASTLVHCE